MADRLLFRSPSDAAGFTMLPNLVLLDNQLSDGAVRTYLVLLHHARQTAKCFPGQDLLAEERGISDRSVRSHLAELFKRGLITPERRGRGETNRYWIEPLDSVYGKISARESSDRKNSSADDRKKTAAPKTLREEDGLFEKEQPTLNVAGEHIDIAQVQEIATVTGDTRSLRRFAQLWGICLENSSVSCWDEAKRSLKNRMANESLGPLAKPGAYFCSVVATLLQQRGVRVPVGTKAERLEVRELLSASLGLD